MNSVCALFYVFYWVFPRAKTKLTSPRGFIKFEIAAPRALTLRCLGEMRCDLATRPSHISHKCRKLRRGLFVVLILFSLFMNDIQRPCERLTGCVSRSPGELPGGGDWKV